MLITSPSFNIDSNGHKTPIDNGFFYAERFPTQFAKILSFSLDIFDWDGFVTHGEYWRLCKSNDDIHHMDAYDFELRVMAMKEFQKLSAILPYEECMSVWASIHLTDEQREGLKTIHKLTMPFVFGDALDIAMERMKNDRTSNKDFAGMLAVVLDILNKPGVDEDGRATSEVKSLVLKITGAEATSGEKVIEGIKPIPLKGV